VSGYDVIVVLGAALASDGDLGPALAERVRAGVAAWREGRAPRLMMTGVHEAHKMKARAVALGVPAEAILVEDTARTTRENAMRCAELMRAHGLGYALVVTQGYHRPRALATFRRVGVRARAYRFAGRNNPRQAAREVVALAVYWARGWI
jgi:uncharacterized SAM-binding protein YcdF (DUF218 family)